MKVIGDTDTNMYANQKGIVNVWCLTVVRLAHKVCNERERQLN